MDIDLQNKINDTFAYLSQFTDEQFKYELMDPVAKMMMVALMGEVQKIEDGLARIDRQIADRFCSDFIPGNLINAVPAITIVQPTFRQNKDLSPVELGNGTVFIYKPKGEKQPVNYIPLFKSLLLPCTETATLTWKKLYFVRNSSSQSHDVAPGVPNRVWIGISTNAEVECLNGLTLLLKGTGGISPQRIYVGESTHELDFMTMRDLSEIQMLEPFDAQQSSGSYFSLFNNWRDALLDMDDATLLYVNDRLVDRDLFKPYKFPKNEFQNRLEQSDLASFNDKTIWLCLEFPDSFHYPDSIHSRKDCPIMVNAIPVVNVDVNNVMLTQANPIAKLQNPKQENSFFLSVLETSLKSQKQGFGTLSEDVVIRDFDANVYHNGDLFRDVRNLYNRFVDDYYAFVEYNGIKDGEVLKQLRETVNKIGKSVVDKNPGMRNSKYDFDSGTYVMKNMSKGQQNSNIAVSFLTTQGYAGNAPLEGSEMEVKVKGLSSVVSQKARVVMSAVGGSDKATADERYELLRYFTLTNDRIYTKMDVDAFLRKEIMSTFGKEEFGRIFFNIQIEGAGGTSSLCRGMYIDISFKDKKNYDVAVSTCFDKLILQKLENHSCISMPKFIRLINLEENNVSSEK